MTYIRVSTFQDSQTFETRNRKQESPTMPFGPCFQIRPAVQDGKVVQPPPYENK